MINLCIDFFLILHNIKAINKINMDLLKIYNKKSLFATKNVGNELILVPVKNSVANMNELFTLNEVGSFVWKNINAQNTIEDITNAVAQEFEVDYQTAKNDVLEFIEHLNIIISKV